MESKAAKRWQFILDGMATVTPEFSGTGEVEYMMVATDFSATKCYTPDEVDAAIDIAIYMAKRNISVYMH